MSQGYISVYCTLNILYMKRLNDLFRQKQETPVYQRKLVISFKGNYHLHIFYLIYYLQYFTQNK